MRSAIVQHAALPQFLTKLLAEHSLPAAAEALELPAATAANASDDEQLAAKARRREALELITAAADVLSVPTLKYTSIYLRSHQPAVLQLVQRLVTLLPTAELDGGAPLAPLWLSVACLLNRACRSLHARHEQMQQSSQEAEQERQVTAWAVVQCLPQLVAALPLVLEGPSSEQLPVLTKVFGQLLAQVPDVSKVDSGEQLQQLLIGTGAAVHIAAGLQPERGAGPGLAKFQGLAAAVLQNSAELAQNFACGCVTAGATALELAMPASAALQLHASGCRLLHRWAAAGEPDDMAVIILCDGLTLVGMAAQTLLNASREPDEGTAQQRWVNSGGCAQSDWLVACKPGQLPSAGMFSSARRGSAHAPQLPLRRVLHKDGCPPFDCRLTALLAAHWEAAKQSLQLLGPISQWEAVTQQGWAQMLTWLLASAPTALLMMHGEQLAGCACEAVSSSCSRNWCLQTHKRTLRTICICC